MNRDEYQTVDSGPVFCIIMACVFVLICHEKEPLSLKTFPSRLSRLNKFGKQQRSIEVSPRTV